MCETVDGYIEEIASLRKELFEHQKWARAVLKEKVNLEARCTVKNVEVDDLKSEISRHHKDFLRIREQSEFALNNPGADHAKALKTIRNIVG